MPSVMSKGLHFLTSGFLVTVVFFFGLAAILFLTGNYKIDDVIALGDDDRNDPHRLKKAFDNARIAYILGFIAAGLSLLLMIMYAGQERVWNVHQGFHAAIYFATYVLIIIAAIYAFAAINELNHPDVQMKNSADTYLWVGLWLLLLGFIGLTATGSGQVSMTSVRNEIENRTQSVETKINDHLPEVRDKVREIHAATTQKLPVQVSAQRTSVQMPLSPSLEPSVTTTTVRKF